MKRVLCPHCKKRLEGNQRIHPECIESFAENHAAKLERAKAKALKVLKRLDREDTKTRKEALKRIPDLIKEAQAAFNAFIRARDKQAGYPCISSGRPLDWSGNAVDAGHFRSTGAASHLRFNEDNCHAQSKHDNQYKSGNAVEYRIRLIERIGLQRVEALESDNQPKKWERDELIAIKAKYKAKLKELQK